MWRISRIGTSLEPTKAHPEIATKYKSRALVSAEGWQRPHCFLIEAGDSQYIAKIKQGYRGTLRVGSTN
jgi:hypothetical protein